MSKVKYIAVTLGPIFKTIGLAESTGALWAASYMFSYLSKSICEYLLEHSEFNISEEDIIVPYYHKNAAGTKEDSAAADVIVSDGVGRFPDHIIFRAKNFDVTNFSALRNSVIRSLANTFGFKEGEGDDYLRRYMLIACTAFDVDEENGENPILKSGLALDSLEFFQPIIRVESCNEIVKAVSNRSVRELPLTQGFENWPLLGEDRTSIRSTEDIADTSKDGKVREQLKKHDYYAVVRSDADAVSKIIASLKADELRNFSRTCVLYCGEMADLVHRYSGVTIYARTVGRGARPACAAARRKLVRRNRVSLRKGCKGFVSKIVQNIYRCDQSGKRRKETGRRATPRAVPVARHKHMLQQISAL